LAVNGHAVGIQKQGIPPKLTCGLCPSSPVSFCHSAVERNNRV